MLSVDRQRGTLISLAFGDAIGAAVVFQMPDTFDDVTGYCGGGPYNCRRSQHPSSGKL
jgi:ADP-ribosyl-[dinitrogen reductase] hydrolase